MKIFAAAFTLILLAGCGDESAPPPPAGPAPATPVSGAAKASTPGATKGQDASVETLAKALLEEAGKREKEKPDRPDLALAAFHDVCVRHPFTEAGRRAAARGVELEGVVQKTIDQEFVTPRAAAEALKKEGRFADAVSGLTQYSDSTKKESLKRRAAMLIKAIENEARRTYVEAVRASRKSVASGRYDEAVKVLKAASERSIPDVVSAAEKDLVLLDRYRRAEESKQSVAAEAAALKAFGDRGPRLLKRLKERAYAEVLKDLDAALADPALEACKERLTADRAATAAAASFWEAMQKTLKARLNQEVAFRMADGKVVRGTLKKVNETGTSVRLEGPGADVALDTLHSDQLLLLGINRDGLAEDAGASYAAAAMWFFLDGRHDMSRLELATATEMSADVTLLEASWRRGFFRAAMAR